MASRLDFLRLGAPMSILLFGKNGQVGQEIQRCLASATSFVALGRDEVDLSHPELVRRAISFFEPKVIINAAAYTAVDRAEGEEDLAHAINCDSVRVMAEEAGARGACLIHYSTDYVFDGEKTLPYVETDQTNPINAYGRTKLAGEVSIRQTGCVHFVFRTSWVFARHGRNFPATILRLATERDELQVVADQIGAPTSAELIAEVTTRLLRACKFTPEGMAKISGIYNLTASGQTSWHGYARHLIEEAALHGATLKTRPDAIHQTTTAAYTTAARRPANSLLDTEKLRNLLGIQLPDWRVDVSRFARQAVTNKA